jgi:predicted TIM-barrel fold metal-dependent hydrolase
VRRLWGEDAALLERAGAPVAELDRLERELDAGLGLPGRGEWADAHVHLGRDRDGHRLTAEDLLWEMGRWGIARAVCFPADDPGPDGTFGAANAAVLEAARRADGRLIPFCRVDPRARWGPALERAALGGARGLKLHPVAQRFALEGPEARACVREAAARGWPVLLHAGYGARPLAGPLAALAEAVPDARLILAHGARGDARAVRDALAGRPGVRYDTSLAGLVDLVELPPGSLLMGSDRPYGDVGGALDLVARAREAAGWDAAAVAGVLGGNLSAWLET